MESKVDKVQNILETLEQGINKRIKDSISVVIEEVNDSLYRIMKAVYETEEMLDLALRKDILAASLSIDESAEENAATSIKGCFKNSSQEARGYSNNKMIDEETDCKSFPITSDCKKENEPKEERDVKIINIERNIERIKRNQERDNQYNIVIEEYDIKSNDLHDETKLNTKKSKPNCREIYDTQSSFHLQDIVASSNNDPVSISQSISDMKPTTVVGDKEYEWNEDFVKGNHLTYRQRRELSKQRMAMRKLQKYQMNEDKIKMREERRRIKKMKKQMLKKKLSGDELSVIRAAAGRKGGLAKTMKEMQQSVQGFSDLKPPNWLPLFQDI